MSIANFHKKVSYIAPEFTSCLNCEKPTSRVHLGVLPTPIHPWNPPGSGFSGVECYIKRDDLTGCDASGNKVRKLEFLIARALEGEYDSVITIGGAQSNHARATAVVSRQLGLEPHLILRGTIEQAHTLTGNLLFDRLVGAQIYPVSPAEYNQDGQVKLCRELEEKLVAEGKCPYVIPVGGSNNVGVWGYMEFVREYFLQQEQSGLAFDHIFFACGSGGTAAGMALGFALARLQISKEKEEDGRKESEKESAATPMKVPTLHAITVCDSPDDFYHHIREMALTLGAPVEQLGDVRNWINIVQGEGRGYALSTPEELQYLTDVATSTGVLVDPVYSGKAMNYVAHHQLFSPGEKCLFLHTGGVFGTYDKVEALHNVCLQPVTSNWR